MGDKKSLEESEERRRYKRERNKQAAARLRQKVLDREKALTKEAESEEQKKAELVAEMDRLLSTSKGLETLLSEHKPVCKCPNSPKHEEDSSNSSCSGTSNSPSNSPKVDSSSTCNESSDIADDGPSNKDYSSYSNFSIARLCNESSDTAIGDISSKKISNEPRESPNNNSCHDVSNRFSNMVYSGPSNIPSTSNCNEFSNSATGDISSNKISNELRESPNNNSYHGVSNRFSNVVYCGPSNIPSTSKCNGFSNRPRKSSNNVVYSDSSRSSDSEISNSPSNVPNYDPNSSPCYDLSKNASNDSSNIVNFGPNSSPCYKLSNINDDYSNSPRNDVVLDEKLVSSAMPSRSTRPSFLAIGGASSSNDSNSSNNNFQKPDLNRLTLLDLDSKRTFEYKTELSNISNNCSNSLRNDVVLDGKLNSSAMPSRPKRPSFLAIGGASSSSDSNSSSNNCQKQDQNRPTVLDLGSKRTFEYKTELSNNCSNSLRNDVVLDKKLDSSAMPSRPTRPSFLPIGGVSYSNDSNSSNNNCQQRDQNRPTFLGSKRTSENKTVETPAFVTPAPGSIEQDLPSPTYGLKLNFESMMEGGTGLTPVDNPNKTFCSFK